MVTSNTLLAFFSVEENKQFEEDVQINISKPDVDIVEQIENILESIEPQ